MHRDVHDFQSCVMDKEKKNGGLDFVYYYVHTHSQNLGRCWMIFADVYGLLSEPYDLSKCFCPFQRSARKGCGHLLTCLRHSGTTNTAAYSLQPKAHMSNWIKDCMTAFVFFSIGGIGTDKWLLTLAACSGQLFAIRRYH